MKFHLEGLDFLETVKLVNYLRSETRKGNLQTEVSSKQVFENDVYLKPVLEDDPLLYSLDDIDEVQAHSNGISSKDQVRELQEELQRLKDQFAEYQLQVQKSLQEQLSKEDANGAADSPGGGPSISAKNASLSIDKDYFSSYSYNGQPPC